MPELLRAIDLYIGALYGGYSADNPRNAVIASSPEVVIKL